MKKTRLVKQNGNDKIYTPNKLALEIVKYFNPEKRNKLLEPCKGEGAFTNAFKTLGYSYDYCEIDEEKDFLEYNKQDIDWIITNPPFSQIRKFLIKSYELSPTNIVFLCTLNAFWMNGKQDDMKKAGFFIKEHA